MADRVLCFPDVQAILAEWDEEKDNQFNAITKLQAIVDKAKTPAHIKWTFHALDDGLKNKHYPDGFKLRAINGQMAGSGGKGIVDLIVYKLLLKNFLLERWVPNLKWSPTVKKEFEDIVAGAFGNMRIIFFTPLLQRLDLIFLLLREDFVSQSIGVPGLCQLLTRQTECR